MLKDIVLDKQKNKNWGWSYILEENLLRCEICLI